MHRKMQSTVFVLYNSAKVLRLNHQVGMLLSLMHASKTAFLFIFINLVVPILDETCYSTSPV